MANRNAPCGLRLWESNGPQSLVQCLVPASDSTVIGKGDVVKLAGSSGRIATGPYCPTVARISAGDVMYGVVEGVYNYQVASSSFSLDRNHRAASVATYVLVRKLINDDVYVIQADDEGATLAVTDVGLNANITGTGGGTTITDCNTISGMSTMVLDTSTKNTTATLQLKIVGFLNTPDNEVGSTNVKVLVSPNNCSTSGGTGTEGV